MEFINFESVSSGIIGGVVSAIIVGMGVLLLKLSKRWSRNQQLKSNMRVALRECRARTIRFKAYADDDLAKHFDDVILDGNPYYRWISIDEDGFDRRKDSVAGQKFFELIEQTKNIGYVKATDRTPEGFRAYADDIVEKVDELLLHLFDPTADT